MKDSYLDHDDKFYYFGDENYFYLDRNRGHDSAQNPYNFRFIMDMNQIKVFFTVPAELIIQALKENPIKKTG